MPWLLMTVDDAEAFDADMLMRCAAIKGPATRYSWPEEATEKGKFALLVAPEHVARLSGSVKDALLAVKPAVIERDVVEPPVIERPVVEPGRKLP